ncbi:MAG: endonuclease III [Nitrospinota bacterium]|jgi:endonuclease-3|nr:endonuclease III [Nitrospinota bacterium]MDP7556248.1 endonuclease III [Nitrospinota bacterium]MDP7580162.1 endonuclease III [Nitrospinota bacterium]HJN02277.1 endonuclease III [Nitrospinota bacterium]|tara:strand:- start:1607 stop:2263 length:657 start_codon:yes stop_codon:yes gene_type:complete
MKNEDINRIIKILKKSIKQWKVPIVTQVAEDGRDPFKVLISCILSLRTKDDTTAAASSRLFKITDNPAKMLKIKDRIMEKTIYPVGFYRTKTRNIKSICRILVDKYKSRVPDEIDELLKLKGVGRKTANLVVTLGYNKLGICVDTHVHRISNRLGYISTTTPEKTEFALRKRLPQKHWIIYNDLLVTFGQNLCKPISPVCSICPIYNYCDRVGVLKSR